MQIISVLEVSVSLQVISENCFLTVPYDRKEAKFHRLENGFHWFDKARFASW